MRTYIRAIKTTAQSIAALTQTKVVFESEIHDTLSEWSNNRFTATKSGRYIITARVGISGLADQSYADILVVTNNGACAIQRVATSGINAGQSVSISETVSMTAGDFVEIHVLFSAAGNVEQFGDRNSVTIQRIA